MAECFLTNESVEDLTAIWDYTFMNWSERQADLYYNMLIDTCDVLANQPKLGRCYDHVVENILGFRASSHVIFYRIISEGKIEVVRILHGSMDLKNHL